ncbi:MAG: hypothetical protein AAGF84_06010 [Planctomycetota bacterium]
MRRRFNRESEDDALDLFLDAISNVFGGILFIALAVVVLLQFTVPKPAEDVELVEVQTAAATSNSDPLEAIRASDLTQDEIEVATQHAVLIERLDEQREQLRRLQSIQTQQQTTLEQASDQLRETQRQHDALRRELLEAQQTLDALRTRPTQRVRAARFRPSAKAEVPLMVAAGRVLRPMNADGSVDSSAVRIDSPKQTARPNPQAGTPIPDGAAGDAALTRLLASLDPQRHYLNAAVWPDGFDAARRLRDTAIDLGFEFTLTPIPEGQGVPFNAASGVQ